MENTKNSAHRKSCTLVDSFDESICKLWKRCRELEQRNTALQNDILQLEIEKTRLTYECEAIRRCAESLARAEQRACQFATVITKKLNIALNALSATEVCSDGRSITAHIEDALKSLRGFYEMAAEEPTTDITEDTSNTSIKSKNMEAPPDEQFFF